MEMKEKFHKTYIDNLTSIKKKKLIVGKKKIIQSLIIIDINRFRVDNRKSS
jgi:hypothetical protein